MINAGSVEHEAPFRCSHASALSLTNLFSWLMIPFWLGVTPEGFTGGSRGFAQSRARC